MAPPAAPCAPWARRSACPPSLPHCRAPAQPRLFGGKTRWTPNEWRPGLVITARRLPAVARGDEAGGTGLDSARVSLGRRARPLGGHGHGHGHGHAAAAAAETGATYEVGVLQQLAGRQVLVLGRLVGVLVAAGGQAGGAPRQLALLQKLHVALVQAVQGAPANAPVEVVHALALQSHRRPLYSAPRPAHAVPLGRSWPGEGLCPFDPRARASLGTT